MTTKDKIKVLKAQRNHLVENARDSALKGNYNHANHYSELADGIIYALKILEDAEFAQREFTRMVK